MVRIGLSYLAAAVAGASASAVLDTAKSIPEGVSSTPNGFDALGDIKYDNGHIQLTALDQPNQASALWASEPNYFDEWTLEATLTARGPASPGGGLALWYALPQQQKTGPVHGSTDYWDGLAVMLDSIDGEGTLRGHLNDGSINFGGFKDPVDRAFSLCRIGYRNTGTQFTIKVGYGQGSLIVDVNGQKCFETNQVVLPRGLRFGVSASSTSAPDSFTISKFNVYNGLLDTLDTHRAKRAGSQARAHDVHEDHGSHGAKDTPGGSGNAVNDERLRALENELASVRASVKGIDRIESVSQQLDSIRGRIEKLEDQTMRLLQAHQDLMASDEKSALSREMDSLRTRIENIHQSVSDHASALGTLPETLAKNTPSIWVLVIVIVAIQGVLIVGYNVYRTRRSYHAKLL
uniref:ARAD1A00792p n=1 Tax=Blastobotrys adeninivorans TaxID=409370 RepID=A0A060SWC7_BLAAD